MSEKEIALSAPKILGYGGDHELDGGGDKGPMGSQPCHVTITRTRVTTRRSRMLIRSLKFGI